MDKFDRERAEQETEDMADEIQRLRLALDRIRNFPYVGTQAAQQMALIAGEALAVPNGER